MSLQPAARYGIGVNHTVSGSATVVSCLRPAWTQRLGDVVRAGSRGRYNPSDLSSDLKTMTPPAFMWRRHCYGIVVQAEVLSTSVGSRVSEAVPKTISPHGVYVGTAMPFTPGTATRIVSRCVVGVRT